MKKLFIVGFSAALIAGGVSSCKKTSKGKMSNEWSVSSVNTESTRVSNSGTKTETTIVLEDGKGTKKTVSTPSTGTASTTEKTAVVTEMTYTIEKDGTWKSFSDVTWTSTFTNSSSSDATKTTTSGTWSFLSKNKSGEFKANERVVFTTLSETEEIVSSTTVSGSTSSSTTTSSDSFASGERAMVYTVVESKSKELQLKSESDNESSFTAGGTTNKNTEVSTTTMTLVQK